MSHDTEKYLYFTVGLLKNSFALDALWQDALKYHLVDQPDRLIALRLTEYYEMKARGDMHAGPGVPIAAMPATVGNGTGSLSDQVDDHHAGDERIVAASPDLEYNADEAAEYWSHL